MITLKKAIRCLDPNEPWTIGTTRGNGWLYYFDGSDIYCGAPSGVTLEDLLNGDCVTLYQRKERKHWSQVDRKYYPYMELEAGMAFIVEGDEDGTI